MRAADYQHVQGRLVYPPNGQHRNRPNPATRSFVLALNLTHLNASKSSGGHKRVEYSQDGPAFRGVGDQGGREPRQREVAEKVKRRRRLSPRALDSDGSVILWQSFGAKGVNGCALGFTDV